MHGAAALGCLLVSRLICVHHAKHNPPSTDTLHSSYIIIDHAACMHACDHRPPCYECTQQIQPQLASQLCQRQAPALTHADDTMHAAAAAAAAADNYLHNKSVSDYSSCMPAGHWPL